MAHRFPGATAQAAMATRQMTHPLVPEAEVSAASGIRTNPIDFYAFPPAQKTRSLIRAYFDRSGLHYPILHLDTFLDTYEEALKDGFKRVQPSWLALLNAALALAMLSTSGFAGTKPSGLDEAELYYRRACVLSRRIQRQAAQLEISKVRLTDIRSHPLIMSKCNVISFLYNSR